MTSRFELQPPKKIPGQDELLEDKWAMGMLKDIVSRFQSDVEHIMAPRASMREWILTDGDRFHRGARDLNWTCAPVPEHMLGHNRRVEITGPPDRKMMINALNSGADVFMVDFEDSLSPTWKNIVDGFINVRDAARDIGGFSEKPFSFSTPERKYWLNRKHAQLMFRPRGLHMKEKNVTFEGKPISATLFDLCMFARFGVDYMRGLGGVGIYIPKLESHHEAVLVENVLSEIERLMGLPANYLKVTVLVETFPAVWQLDDIVWSLKNRIVGLNCGRWDYIFSVIKTYAQETVKFILDDKEHLNMSLPFLRSYADLVVKTCERRGIVPIGGMSALIPSKYPDVNAKISQVVLLDKQNERRQGFEGAWVAHPGLVSTVRDVMGSVEPDPPSSRVQVQPGDLKKFSTFPTRVTKQGLENDVRVGCVYLENWLNGKGCVAIDGLMEDAATVEISRTLVWQRVQSGFMKSAEVSQIVDAQPVSELAKKIFKKSCLGELLPDFITTLAYEHID